MAIINPITHAETLALSWALEPERKLQALLQLWLANYFKGTPFTTRRLGGGTEQKTFADCLALFQEAEVPQGNAKPLIHILMDKIDSERLAMTEATHGHEDRWVLTVMVKVPAATTATAQEQTDAEYLVRRIANQALWLFSSSEREALAAHGVSHLEVTRGPTVFSGGAWLARIMTAECTTFREQAR